MVGIAKNYSYIYGVRLPKWQEFKFKKNKSYGKVSSNIKKWE